MVFPTRSSIGFLLLALTTIHHPQQATAFSITSPTTIRGGNSRLFVLGGDVKGTSDGVASVRADGTSGSASKDAPKKPAKKVTPPSQSTPASSDSGGLLADVKGFNDGVAPVKFAKEPKAPPPEYGSITPVVKGFSDGVAPIKVAKDATPPKQVSSNLDADVKGFNDGVAPVKVAKDQGPKAPISSNLEADVKGFSDGVAPVAFPKKEQASPPSYENLNADVKGVDDFVSPIKVESTKGEKATAAVEKSAAFVPKPVDTSAPPAPEPVETPPAPEPVVVETLTPPEPVSKPEPVAAQVPPPPPQTLIVTPEGNSIQKDVQEYYGQTLQSSDDLKTNACCTAGAPPKYIQDCINNIHPEVVSKYYGCGLCLPNYDLQGTSILDLGCGAGRDVYIASQLVGPSGRVVGIDMTEEQLETARSHQTYHANKFPGHNGKSNVQFVQGYLESLADIAELEDNSFDVIISNCVLNLCSDKQAVLNACYSKLKPGGELYFSDVYSNRRVPTVLQEDKTLWGECLSGALYWNDFQNMAKRAGFLDPRLVEDAPITISNKAVQETIASSGHTELEFYSATYRLLKMDDLEPACEDYGQAVVYKGTIPQHESTWTLDKHHIFETGRMFPVCGNTYKMLYDNPRARAHFDFYGNFDKHYGIFEGCGTSIPYDAGTGSSTGKGSSSASGGGGCC